ncbi:MAG: hypothetical protein OES57_04775, partial [Acidimicrobiia bacterium]|nr:hypothetical protein [Acidimicrobiia bacterium]
QLMPGTATQRTVELIGSSSPRVIKLAFLAAGFASLSLSVALWFSGNREEGLFVGLWVPAIHSLGSLVLAGER